MLIKQFYTKFYVIKVAILCDGFRGTVKIYLYKAFIDSCKVKKSHCFCYASFGVAALLLPSGRTAHSRFKLPLEMCDDVSYSISYSLHW